jgi:signal transduction histidine kinase
MPALLKRETSPDSAVAYHEARRSANRRIGFLGHTVIWGAVCLFLFVVIGFWPGIIVALGWGIGLVAHGFFGVVAPFLRRRWIDDEVRRQLHSSVVDERRSLETKHTRSLCELSASIAHEVRNPITAAKSLVQQIAEDPAAKENVEYAHIALGELDRVERSISHLLRFAREEDLALEDVRLADVVDSALETLRDRVGKSGVTIERDLGAVGPVRGDLDKLRRVIINLVGNALDAHEDAGVADPHVRISAGHDLAGANVWIRVKDNGPGIEPDQLGRIFNPFHTSKATGTGLGLAITRRLVEVHGGIIEATSTLGAGAEFLLTFPTGGKGGAT